MTKQLDVLHPSVLTAHNNFGIDVGFLLKPKQSVLPFDIQLPEFDCRQVEHGVSYKPHLKAGRQRKGTGSSNYGRKVERTMECLSCLERHYLLAFEHNNFIIDIREQYAMADDAVIRRLVEANRPIRRTDVKSIDFVLTLKLPWYPELIYIGVSVKEFRELCEPKIITRHCWEKQACASLGWGWLTATEKDIDAVSARSRSFLREFTRRTPVADFVHLLPHFAKLIRSTRRSSTLSQRIANASKALGIDMHDGFRAFAFSVQYAYLAVDLSQEMGERRLVLIA